MAKDNKQYYRWLMEFENTEPLPTVRDFERTKDIPYRGLEAFKYRFYNIINTKPQQYARHYVFTINSQDSELAHQQICDWYNITATQLRSFGYHLRLHDELKEWLDVDTLQRLHNECGVVELIERAKQETPPLPEKFVSTTAPFFEIEKPQVSTPRPPFQPQSKVTSNNNIQLNLSGAGLRVEVLDDFDLTKLQTLMQFLKEI